MRKKSLNSVIKCHNYLFFVLFCSCYTETDFQRYELTVWKVSKQLHINKQENYSVNAVKGSSYETKSFSCKAALHKTIMPLFRTIMFNVDSILFNNSVSVAKFSNYETSSIFQFQIS